MGLAELSKNHPAWDAVYENLNLEDISNVTVDFDAKYCRKSHPELDELAEKIWEDKTRNNARLYNAEKFRLHDYVIGNNKKLTLQLGLTDYKSIICTNHYEDVETFYEYGMENYNDKFACLANGLGVGAIVITSDDYIVLNRRASWVGESPGSIDTPGGHAEPEELEVPKPEVVGTKNERIRYELFESMLREVRDEVNIPMDKLTFPKLLAVVRNNTLGSKPGLIFVIKCSIARNEVELLYHKGGLETDESTEIIFVSVKDVVSSTTSVMEIIADMSPCGEAAMLLFYKHLKAMETQAS